MIFSCHFIHLHNISFFHFPSARRNQVDGLAAAAAAAAGTRFKPSTDRNCCEKEEIEIEKKNESSIPNKRGKKDVGETIEEPEASPDESGFNSTLGESIYEDFDDPKIV